MGKVVYQKWERREEENNRKFITWAKTEEKEEGRETEKNHLAKA